MNAFKLNTTFFLASIVLLFIFKSTFSTTINVTASNFQFTPSTISAVVGDTVHWTWLNGSHTTTCDGSPSTSRPAGAAPWNSPINSGMPVFNYVVTVAGTYNYKCSFHAGFGMVGVINASGPPLTLNLTALIQGFWNGSTMVSDTVTVYLNNPTSPFARVDSQRVFLNSSGNGILNFTHAAAGSYYIVVKHRNSIETWSKLPLSFTSGGTTTYDFTTSADKAFGNNQIFKGGKFTIYSGDVNQDGTVDLSDIILIFNDANNFVTGYVRTDVNGDNITDLSDIVIAYNNSTNFVTVMRP